MTSLEAQAITQEIIAIRKKWELSIEVISEICDVPAILWRHYEEGVIPDEYRLSFIRRMKDRDSFMNLLQFLSYPIKQRMGALYYDTIIKVAFSAPSPVKWGNELSEK